MNKPTYIVTVIAPDYSKKEQFQKLHNAVEYALKSAKKIEPELEITDENLHANIDAIVEEFRVRQSFSLSPNNATINITQYEHTRPN